MIKLLLFTTLFNTYELQALPPEVDKIEARRRRGKQNKGRKRGGNGLR